MRNFKKVIAGALALLMLALSVNVSFAAEEYSDVEAIAVAKVNAAAIMTGTDKGFEPAKSLTRAEAAAIMVRMKGISESTVKQSAGTTLFTDVPASHWAAGYVNVASNYGIIVGVGANKFAPEKEVTVAEFYTMAVRALGAGKLVDSEGTWPTNYVNFAIENDLAEDVAQVYAQTSTRITAAIIVANTLEAKLWEKSQVRSNGEITWEAKNKTILKDVLNIDKHIEGDAIKVDTVSNVDHLVNDLDCDEDLDLSNIKIGMTYEYWTNKDGDIIGLWIPSSNDSVEFTEIKDYKVKTDYAEIKLVVNGKEKEYKIDLTNASSAYTKLPTVVKNEKTVALDTATAQTTDGKVKLVDAFKDNKNIKGIAYVDDNYVKQIYFTEFTAFAAVKDATEKRVSFQTASEYVGFASSSLSLTTKDKEYFLTKDGKAMDFADLEEDDVIRYYTVDSDKIVAEVVEPAASGKVVSTRSKNTNELVSIKIDGTSYDVTNSGWTIKADDEITIYLNEAGKVAAYIKDKEAKADYGYIKYARTYNDGYGKNLEIQLVLSDGSVSDKMLLDTAETKKKFGDSHEIDFETANEAKYNSNTIAKLGAVVCYEVKNGKAVIKPLSDNEYASVSGELKVTNKTKTIGGYYLTDNTKVFKMKEISNKAYELDVEEIDVEDLDTTTVTTGSYVAGIDKDTKEISTLYLEKTTSVARSGEANFAFITKVWSTKDGDDTVNEIEVILMDGSKETYLVSKDRVLLHDATVSAGEFVDLTINNDKVTKLDRLNASGNDALIPVTLNNAVIRKAVTGSRYALGTVVTEKAAGAVTYETGCTLDGVAKTSGTNDAKVYMTKAKTYFTTEAKAYESLGEFVVAENVLVLEANKVEGADKWTVRELSDIETYKDNAELKASEEVDVVLGYYTYQEESNDVAEAILVIYVNDVEKSN